MIYEFSTAYNTCMNFTMLSLRYGKLINTSNISCISGDKLPKANRCCTQCLILNALFGAFLFVPSQRHQHKRSGISLENTLCKHFIRCTWESLVKQLATLSRPLAVYRINMRQLISLYLTDRKQQQNTWRTDYEDRCRSKTFLFACLQQKLRYWCIKRARALSINT